MQESKSAAADVKATGWRKRRAALALVLLTIGVVAFFAMRPAATPPVVAKVTIALPMQINSASVIVAAAQGLFEKAGVTVISQPFLLGKDALQSLLDGKADLAVVADTPFMFAALNGSDVAVLAGISQSRRSLALVARTDRGIDQLGDLKGKSVALTMGTNLPYFLDALLQSHRISADAVKRVDARMPEVISAFRDGRVDAAMVFQPFLAQLQAEMRGAVKVFFGEDVYAFRFLLVGKPAYIDTHPQEVRRILGALIAANTSISADPEAARRVVGEAIKVDANTMTRLIDPVDYVVSLDQAMLLALDDQTRWAMTQGLAKTGPVPNYLQFMKIEPLEAVMPAAVQIVH